MSKNNTRDIKCSCKTCSFCTKCADKHYCEAENGNPFVPIAEPDAYQCNEYADKHDTEEKRYAVTALSEKFKGVEVNYYPDCFGVFYPNGDEDSYPYSFPLDALAEDIRQKAEPRNPDGGACAVVFAGKCDKGYFYKSGDIPDFTSTLGLVNLYPTPQSLLSAINECGHTNIGTIGAWVVKDAIKVVKVELREVE